MSFFCLDHTPPCYLWQPHSNFASNSVLPQLDRLINRLLPGLLFNRPIFQKSKNWGGNYLVIWACLSVSVLVLPQRCPLQNLVCIHSITLPFRLNICIFTWKLKQHIQIIVEATSWVPVPPFLHSSNSCYVIICIEQRIFCCFLQKHSGNSWGLCDSI